MFYPLFLASIISIIHSTDAGVDDFATTALLSAVQNREEKVFSLDAVVITNADSEPVSALSGYLKFCEYLQLNCPVGMSRSAPWNQFPWIWRLDSMAVDALPCLRGITKENKPARDGDEILASVLKEKKRVVIVATGPLSTIRDVLRQEPDLAGNIEAIHWMGGAIDCPGNLIGSPEFPRELLNESAEWNVFSDPESVDWIFKNTNIAIHLYPLDISDTTLPNDFVRVLRDQKRSHHLEFVDEAYQLVEHIEAYRMWDVVAAAGVLFPDLFLAPRLEKLNVGLHLPNEGALFRDPEGREVFVYSKFKSGGPDEFYRQVAKTLSDGL